MAGKPTLNDVNSLPDAMLQDNYEIIITAAPDEIMSEQDIRNMRLQCFSTGVPGRTVESAPLNLFGFEVHYAGRSTVTHSWTVTFSETRNFSILRPLERWSNYCRHPKTQHGASKVYYAGRVQINMLSEAGLVIASAELLNVWPETTPELNLDGSSTGIVQLPVTFKFDEWQYLYDGGAGASSTMGGVNGVPG